MRKVVWALAALAITISSCNQKELNRLRKENAELSSANTEIDSMLTNYAQAIDEIGSNLDSIKLRENSINLAMEEGYKRKTDQIKDDVALISQWMQDNQAKIKKLEKRLAGSSFKNAELRKLLTNLQRQLEEKDQDIAELGASLAAANIKIDNLLVDVASLTERRDELENISAEQAAAIDAKNAELNTAYYIVGTKDQLREMDIVDRKGVVAGYSKRRNAPQNLKTSAFTKIDLRKTTTITINEDKVRLATNHPVGSYTLVGEDPIKQIKITDPAKFWSVSKYLVVILD